MPIKRFAGKLKEKKESFDSKKQGLEETGLMGSLRSGRIDVVDEARAALSNWWDSLGQEQEIIRQMKEMFECLQAGIRRAINKEEEYAPKEDPTVNKAFNEALRDLLERAIKDREYDKDGFTGNWEDQKYNKMNNAISGNSELEEKATKVAKGRKSGSNPPTSGKNRWAKTLAHEINNKSDADSALDEAKSEISKLSGGKSKASKFRESMDAFKGQQGHSRKLHQFAMTMSWAERDTEANIEQVSEATEGNGPVKNDGGSNKEKHEKKIRKFQDEYAKLVNEALDTLIDVRDSVDSDNQTKVITPREKSIYMNLQKFTSKSWSLIREAEKKAEQASTGG